MLLGVTAMKIKPVINAKVPDYPDKYDECIKRILNSSTPNRWIGTPIIGVLSAAVSLGLGGCAGPNEFEPNDPDNPVIVTSPPIIEHVLMGDVPAPTQYYFQGTHIPLFEFGDGTGSIGCVAIIAPVFMTEEEAFAVISTAFEEAGLYFSHFSGSMNNMSIPVTNLQGEDVDGKVLRGTLSPNGLLASYDLPVAFVSTSDIANWHQDIGDGPWISFSTYQIKQAALALSENNKDLVVFYDPVAGEVSYDKLWSIEKEDGESDESFWARMDEVRKEIHENALAESIKLLQQQVDAFIAWLFEIS